MKKSSFTPSLKALSILLAIVMVIMSLPLSAFAIGIGENDESIPLEFLNEGQSDDVIEIVERREENIKHYKLQDGSYIAVQYNLPVHYLDENETWQDIDNTLTAAGNEYQSSTARVKFAKNTNSSKTVFLKDDDYQLSFGLIGAKKSKTAVVTNPETPVYDASVSKFEQLSTLTKLVSKVKYENAYTNTDIEYVLVGNNIKENIIVKDRIDGDYSYSFELKSNNLSASLNQDGSISVFDSETKQTIYTIPTPYMYDATGAHSYSVQYSMTQKNNKYTITVTADKEWINSSERVFPVVIDPTINYVTSQVDITYVSPASPNTNYSTADCMGVSKTTTGIGMIGLSKLRSIPTLPDNTILTEATINLERRSDATSGHAAVAVSKITSNWGATTVTYATKPTYNSEILDICRTNTLSTDYSWDITALMKEWMSEQTANYGIAFWITEDSPASQIEFYVTNNANDDCKPFYQIKYRDTKGVEEYYDYFSSSADGAGNGFVNAFGGNLVFLHDSISTTDELLPYTFGLAYNNVLSNMRIASSNTTTPDEFVSTAGKGFKLYTEETLVYRNINNGGTDNYYYIWSDSDGTEHYFRWYNYTLPGSTGVTKYFCDEDGLQLHIIEERNESAQLIGYKICDDQNNIRHFNAAGYLDYIEDVNGNRRCFNRDGNNRITSISLLPNEEATGIEQLTFAYVNGSLASVTNVQTGLVANFYYSSVYNGTSLGTSGDYLRKITYVYSSSSTYSVSFEYDAKGQLVFAKDLKTKLAVGYDYDGTGTDVPGRVTGIHQYANVSETLGISGTTIGQSAGITYAVKQTTYRSSGKDDVYGNIDDIYTVYNFDDTGKAASVYTTDNTFIYGASNYTYADKNEDANDVNASVKAAKTKNSLSSAMTIGGAATNYLSNPGFENNATNALYPSEWYTYGGATLSTVDFYDNDNTYMNMYIPYTNTSNNRTYNISFIEQWFYVEPGTYTFSAAINRYHLKENAEVKIVIYNDMGDAVAESVPVRAYDTSYTLSNLWERLSVTFDVDTEDCLYYGWYVQIELKYFNSNNTTGTSFVYVDSAMLEKGRGVSSYSLLGNGGFEYGSSGWTFTNAAMNYSGLLDGEKAIQVTGKPTQEANAKTTNKFLYDNAFDPYEGTEYYMDAPLSFVVSGWAKANSVTTKYPENYTANSNKDANFAIKAVFHYYNTDFTSTHYIPFNDKVTEWQFASGVISTQPEMQGDTPLYHYVTSVDIYCCYDYNANTAYFDNISVSKCSDIVSYYVYNDMGYLEYSGSADGNGVSYEYENNQIDIKKVKTKNADYETQYDTKHRITLSFDTNGTNNYKTSYEYDAYGNVTLTKMTELGSNPRITQNSTTYSTNSSYFGAKLTETDATGAVNRYFYNSKGQLTGVCDANGKGLVYAYNTYGQLYSARTATYNSASDSMNIVYEGYVYNYYNSKGQLSGTCNNTATYSFSYDAFGNNTGIRVNDELLVQYNYAANNGKLLSQQYGNGASVSYVYDGVDRVIGICYNGSQTASFAYSYNANGQISEHQDLKNDRTYVHNYDASGKLLETTVKCRSTNKVSYMVKNTYDDQGRLSSVFNYYTDTKAAPLSYTEYAYDEIGNLNVVKMGGTAVNLNYTFDASGRLSKKVYAKDLNGNVYITQDYNYETRNGNQTSGQLSSTVLTDATASITTDYQYDSAGNITSIVSKQNGTVISERSYQYDSKGQLIRENIRSNPSSTSSYYNYTMTYAYDNSGNILWKRKYAYTTATTLSGSYTQTNYSYKSDEYDEELDEELDYWNDLLTSYNGNAITYDSIGNPLTYGNYTTFQWNGRQLMQYHYYQEYQYEGEPPYISEDLLQFEYDAEGRRTVKNNQLQRNEYTWDGDKLIRQEVYEIYSTPYMSRDIRFYYDAEGKPSAFRVFCMNREGTITEDLTYFLVTNPQGDVIAIYNSTGTKIYTYEYDAWGNMVKGTNVASGGYTADAYNPFRYRGYIWDWESGLYYVNSRYYNPQWGRFISADVPEVSASSPDSVLRYNLFAYCLNNPVNLTDNDGMWPKWATKLIIGTAFAIAAVAITVATAGTGAAAIIPAALAVGKTLVVGAAVGAATNVVSNRITTGSWDGSLDAAIDGASTGYMFAGIGAFASSATNALQMAGKIPKRVKISNLRNNPTDPYSSLEPKQGAVVEKINKYLSTGRYEYPSVKPIGGGLYEIQNGHHTVQALRSIGKKVIKVMITR